jgi:hypothetical protein
MNHEKTQHENPVILGISENNNNNDYPSQQEQQQPNSSAAITITTTLRVIFITIVFLAFVSLFALIIWGICISPKDVGNPSKIVGLPTIYDMLYRSMPITVLYVVIISLWGETRVIWAVMQLIEPNREEKHWPVEFRSSECCFMQFSTWFEYITFINTILAAFQVLFLMLLAVISVTVNPTHQIIAGLMVIVTILRAILLIVRRGAVHQQRRKTGHDGSSKWHVVRFFYMSNLVAIITSGIVYGIVSNLFKEIPNIAIAQYLMFFCSIVDIGFQIFDSPATHDALEEKKKTYDCLRECIL